MNFANKVSIFRIISIPFFLTTVLYYSPQRDILRYVALGIFLLAVLSDFIDGYIARVKKQKTKFGSIIDPLADKLLLTVSFICLFIMGKDIFPGTIIPLWVVLVIISRDIILLIGAIIIYILKEDLSPSPSYWGKLTTFFQMSTIIAFLLRFSYVNIIWSIAVFFTIVSGMQYVRKGVLILSVIDAKNSPKHNH